MENKEYLGDGVYVATDHGSLILTVENGVTATDVISLDGEVYDALVRYVDRASKKAADHAGH